MNLTDEQRETLARCFYCQTKINPTIAGDALERGNRPHQLRCERCGGNRARQDEALQKHGGIAGLIDLAGERAREAGVLEIYQQENLEAELRDRGENN
jgi:DNA-directed RNA polymerase subunit RPC12/RpoP